MTDVNVLRSLPAELDQVHHAFLLDHDLGYAYPRARLAKMLGYMPPEVHTLLTGECVVGYACLHEEDPFLRIGALLVLPQHRDRGYARAAFPFFEALAEKRLLQGLRLQVNVTNARAKQLYFSLGFRQQSALPNYYGPHRHGLLLEKRLTA